MAQQGDQVYRHPHAPVESRIKDLISRMNLKEKIGQMTLVERRVLTLADLREGRFGTPSVALFSFFLIKILHRLYNRRHLKQLL